MATLAKTHVNVLIVLLFSRVCLLRKPPRSEVFQKAAENCKLVAQEAVLFDEENIVGELWRVYYSWNIELVDKCADITFKNATEPIIRRFYNDMSEYLEEQPEWRSATLKVNMGQFNREVLLIPDANITGRFLGVANVVQVASLTATKKAVPLLVFHLKMIDGKYLLFMDCHLGVAMLSARINQLPYRADIEGVISGIPIEANGHHACVTEKGKEEFIGQMDHQSIMKEIQRSLQ